MMLTNSLTIFDDIICLESPWETGDFSLCIYLPFYSTFTSNPHIV